MRRAAILLGVVALAGCGGGAAKRPDTSSERTAEATTPAPAPAPKPPARLAPANCSPGRANCRAASGTVTYVQAVDPDGDGDAHFVLASRESITLPGITVIDCKKSLRPHPLPRLGDRVAAAGPVYPGSYGQHQIQATEVHVARR
jgi:hypothetical protein